MPGVDDTLRVGPKALKRMDNVGIVVGDLGGAVEFFRELDLELERRIVRKRSFP
jgi:hypothetical protein